MNINVYIYVTYYPLEKHFSQHSLVYIACTLRLVYNYTSFGITFQWLF